MAGRPQKAAGRRVGHRGGEGTLRALPPATPPDGLATEERCGALHVAEGGQLCRFARESCTRAVVPAPPTGLLKRPKEIWVRFWVSDAAVFIDAGTLHRVERWIRDLDELERAWRVYRSERFVEGSMKQTVLNPVWRVIQDCEARLARAETELGLTPLAFARLEAVAGDAALKRAELNRRMNEEDDPGRLRAVEPGAMDGEWQPL